MKQVKLSKVKDGGKFRLSKRSDVEYKVVLKKKKEVTITSTNSERSFIKPLDTLVWID